MAKLVKQWEDGTVLTVAYDGSCDGTAIVSSETNEDIDRSMPITFVDSTRNVFVERVVSQVGLREELDSIDGGFSLSDGGLYKVLKV